jgi:hypothetical protein
MSQNLNYIKLTGKVKIPIFDLALSYMALIFIVVLPWGFISSAALVVLVNGKLPIPFVSISSLIYSVLLITILLNISKKLRLHKVVEGIADGVSDRLIVKALKRLNWSYEKLSDFEYIASAGISWYSWGEIIRIIYYEDKIFINSIGKTSPITFGKDKRNVNKFKTEIINIIKEEN